MYSPSRSLSVQKASAPSQYAAARPVNAVASSATCRVAPPCAQRVIEKGAALDSCYPLRWIDLDGPHAREIDDNAAVARPEAGDAVAPAANRNDEIVLAGEADRRDDVHDTSAPRDEREMAVGHCVPDDAAGVVLAIAGLDQLAAKAIPELFKRGRIETLGNGSSSPS